jgi:hypothetical protein
MTIKANRKKLSKNNLNINKTMVDSVKILSDTARRDIEKSYNLDAIRGTEAYYSGRYGWTLRKSID